MNGFHRLTSPEQRPTLQPVLSPRLNAVLGSLIVTIGFWLMWGDVPVVAAVALALGIATFLAWRGSTIALVWAWTTLLLGLESLAWPIATMLRMRMMTAEPTEEQMGQMLIAILFGLFSAIFWMTFAYGIYKRLVPDKGGTADKPSSRRGQV